MLQSIILKILIESLLFFLLMSSITIVPLLSEFYYDQKRLIELALLFSALVCCIFSRFTFPYCFSIKTLSCLSILLLLLILSGIHAASIKYAAIEIITLLAIVFTIIQISKVYEHHSNIFNIALIVLLSSFFISEIEFYSYYVAFISLDNSFNIHNFFPHFAHTRFFNQYQLWSIPLLTFAVNIYAVRQSRLKYLIWFICISWWLMLFTTGGRGVIVSIISTTIVVTLFFRKPSFDFIKRTLLLALFGFLLYQLLFHAIPYFIHQDNDQLASSLQIRTSSSGRDILWLKALRLTRENPILGVGPMHYGWFDPTGLDVTLRILHPHNSLLQLASEWGIPATLLAVYLIINLFKKWLTKFNRNSISKLDLQKKYLVIALTFSSLVTAFYSLFSGVFIMPMSQLMGIFIISLMIAIYREDETPTPLKKHNYAWFFVPLTCVYVFLIYPDIEEVTSVDYTKVNAKDLHPRLWLRGNIYQRVHGF